MYTWSGVVLQTVFFLNLFKAALFLSIYQKMINDTMRWTDQL